MEIDDADQTTTGTGNVAARADTDVALDANVTGLMVQQVAPYGVILLLLVWIIMNGRRNKQLIDLVHCALKLGRDIQKTNGKSSVCDECPFMAALVDIKEGRLHSHDEVEKELGGSDA